MRSDDEALDGIRRVLMKHRETPFDSMEAVRARYDSLTANFELLSGTDRAALRVGDRAAEWVSAVGIDPEYVVLLLHGGGFFTGSLDSHRVFASYLSRATKSRVLVLDYRLAPEHPFPAAHEDAIACYRWIVEQGFDPSRTAIVGDSAGGGLAISTLARLRAHALPAPSSAAVVGPMFDLEVLGRSYDANAELDPWMTIESHRAVIDAFLRGADPRDPIANPLYADLAGLPPILIQVSEDEMFLDDSVAMAERLDMAGVPVSLERWDGVLHDWHLFAPVLASGTAAIERIGEFVLEHRRSGEGTA